MKVSCMKGIKHYLKRRIREIKVLSTLRTYFPGRYPPELLDENRLKFKSAGISNPEELLRNTSIALHAVALLLAVLVYNYGSLLSLNTYIPNNAFSSPHLPVLSCPVRSALLALITYLTTPLLIKPAVSTLLSTKISARREDIDANLHKCMITMLGFAKSGLTVPEILRELALMDFGELSKEFAGVHYAVAYGSTGFKAALLDMASTTPSRELKEFVRGIVSVMEAGGDLPRYLEDRLNTLSVNKKLWFSEYLNKLKLVSESYLVLTLVLPIMMIVVESSKMLMGNSSGEMLKAIIYVFIPLCSLALVLILHTSSPEKNVKKRGLNLLVLIPAGFLAGLAVAAIAKMNIEFWAIACTAGFAAISAISLHRLVSDEEKITIALPVYFNRVVALVEAGKDIPAAFRLASRDEPDPLGRVVKVFSEMLDKGIPKHKAFIWLSKRTASQDLQEISRILSKTAVVSGRLAEVLLTLLGELNRLIAFRKERIATTRSCTAVMLIAFFLYLGVASAISTTLFAEFSKASASNVSGFTINPAAVSQVKEMMRHAGYIIATATAVGIGAGRGDMRVCPMYLVFLLSIALVVNVLFLSLNL